MRNYSPKLESQQLSSECYATRCSKSFQKNDLYKKSVVKTASSLLNFPLITSTTAGARPSDNLSSEPFYVISPALFIIIIMPKVPKPGTSAEHQRAAEATALKRVNKFLKAGKSFVGEDDRVLRIRDEHLETLRQQNSGQSSKPTLSAEEADSLVANLPTSPRSGYTLRADISAPPASRQPTPTILPDASDYRDSPQDTLPSTEQRRAPTPSLGRGQIEYVGKQISSKGLSMTLSKIRAFLDIPRPTDVTSLRKFLGVGNCFRNFIQGHSTVAGSINRMLTGKLKKRTSLTWLPEGIKHMRICGTY